MNAILYFVTAGFVRESHREAASIIAEKTGKKVVFRNATGYETETPEDNEGVAGLVPAAYARATRYDDEGAVVSPGCASPSIPAGERKLNAIGLPDGDGNPEDRDGLKGALKAEGIDFHGNAKTDTLVDLYLAHFYPED